MTIMDESLLPVTVTINSKLEMPSECLGWNSSGGPSVAYESMDPSSKIDEFSSSDISPSTSLRNSKDGNDTDTHVPPQRHDRANNNNECRNFRSIIQNCGISCLGYLVPEDPNLIMNDDDPIQTMLTFPPIHSSPSRIPISELLVGKGEEWGSDAHGDTIQSMNMTSTLLNHPQVILSSCSIHVPSKYLKWSSIFTHNGKDDDENFTGQWVDGNVLVSLPVDPSPNMFRLSSLFHSTSIEKEEQKIHDPSIDITFQAGKKLFDLVVSPPPPSQLLSSQNIKEQMNQNQQSHFKTIDEVMLQYIIKMLSAASTTDPTTNMVHHSVPSPHKSPHPPSLIHIAPCSNSHMKKSMLLSFTTRVLQAHKEKKALDDEIASINTICNYLMVVAFLSIVFIIWCHWMIHRSIKMDMKRVKKQHVSHDDDGGGGIAEEVVGRDDVVEEQVSKCHLPFILRGIRTDGMNRFISTHRTISMSMMKCLSMLQNIRRNMYSLVERFSLSCQVVFEKVKAMNVANAQEYDTKGYVEHIVDWVKNTFVWLATFYQIMLEKSMMKTSTVKNYVECIVRTTWSLFASGQIAFEKGKTMSAMKLQTIKGYLEGVFDRASNTDVHEIESFERNVYPDTTTINSPLTSLEEEVPDLEISHTTSSCQEESGPFNPSTTTSNQTVLEETTIGISTVKSTNEGDFVRAVVEVGDNDKGAALEQMLKQEDTTSYSIEPAIICNSSLPEVMEDAAQKGKEATTKVEERKEALESTYPTFSESVEDTDQKDEEEITQSKPTANEKMNNPDSMVESITSELHRNGSTATLIEQTSIEKDSSVIENEVTDCSTSPRVIGDTDKREEEETSIAEQTMLDQMPNSGTTGITTVIPDATSNHDGNDTEKRCNDSGKSFSKQTTVTQVVGDAGQNFADSTPALKEGQEPTSCSTLPGMDGNIDQRSDNATTMSGTHSSEEAIKQTSNDAPPKVEPQDVEVTVGAIVSDVEHTESNMRPATFESNLQEANTIELCGRDKFETTTDYQKVLSEPTSSVLVKESCPSTTIRDAKMEQMQQKSLKKVEKSVAPPQSVDSTTECENEKAPSVSENVEKNKEIQRCYTKGSKKHEYESLIKGSSTPPVKKSYSNNNIEASTPKISSIIRKFQNAKIVTPSPDPQRFMRTKRDPSMVLSALKSKYSPSRDAEIVTKTPTEDGNKARSMAVPVPLVSPSQSPIPDTSQQHRTTVRKVWRPKQRQNNTTFADELKSKVKVDDSEKNLSFHDELSRKVKGRKTFDAE